jgi:short-subunit dehydrogenase
MRMNGTVVLVTGASSGIGQATARLLSQRGYRVFGTSRDPERMETVPGVEALPLDVRSDESVAACVESVLRENDTIHALVNSAGFELGGSIEEVSLDEAKAQFETNVFGVMRMVKATLPLMRQQRGGRIIIISSLAGLSPIPFLGVYSASKFALEGYGEALRHEVRAFGVSVSLVEPGFVKTPLAHNRQYAAMHLPDYDPWRQLAFEAIREYEARSVEPGVVAECILRILQSRSPKLRYGVGKDAKFVPALRRILPESLFEGGLRSHFRLDRAT